MSTKQQYLLFGVGNPALTDDGIGAELLDYFKEKNLFPNTAYKKEYVGGLELIDQIAGYNKIVFIDAIKTKDGQPGTVYSFKASNFRETLHLSCPHDTNFLPALELGRKLELAIPEDENILVIAIEVVEIQTLSDDFSPEIADKYGEIQSEVQDIICKFFETA